jgi:hypothetical protein
MHFTSSHQTISLSDVTIQGLADTTVYDDLKPSDAENALIMLRGWSTNYFDYGAKSQPTYHWVYDSGLENSSREANAIITVRCRASVPKNSGVLLLHIRADLFDSPKEVRHAYRS